MTWRCWLGLKWLCPFRRPPRPPSQAGLKERRRRVFDSATARLRGAALDQVDAAAEAARDLVDARDRVRQVGVRAEKKAEESPIMRAANEAAQQISGNRGLSSDA